MAKRSPQSQPQRAPTWRDRWYEVIFEADTPAGKLFDVVLLIAILVSVAVVMLESVEGLGEQTSEILWYAEWCFTVLFTIEYVARIACARRPLRYIFSFYGMVDLLAILPSYIFQSHLLDGPEGQRLAVIRALRLLRAFRIFKLAHMLSEAAALREAIWAARAKIAVFLSVVLIAIVIVGSAMHLIEGGRKNATDFDSIPGSMYWAVVTMTTVGYGDVSPATPLGKALAACMMILGYCMIIVPTGIVSAELAHASGRSLTTQVCPECMSEGHDADAVHCKYCGGKL